MKKLFVFAPALALLVGCGLTEEKFSEDFVAKYCDAWTACGVEGDCPVSVSDDTDDSIECDFDASAASDCLDAEYTCDETTSYPTVPEVCSNVVSNCTGGEDTSGDGGDDTGA